MTRCLNIVIPKVLRVENWRNIVLKFVAAQYPDGDDARLYVSTPDQDDGEVQITLQYKTYNVFVNPNADIPDHAAFWKMYTTATERNGGDEGGIFYGSTCVFFHQADALTCYAKLQLQNVEILPGLKLFKEIKLREEWRYSQ